VTISRKSGLSCKAAFNAGSASLKIFLLWEKGQAYM
jgi:hypothetical protein